MAETKLKIIDSDSRRNNGFYDPDFDPWDTPGELYTGIPSPGAAVFPWYAFQPIGPVPAFPTIAVAFSEPVDASNFTNKNNLSMFRSPLLNWMGRNPVNGDWQYASTGTVSSNCPNADPVSFFPNGPHSVIQFVPTDIIIPNNRYMIHVGANLTSESGVTLGFTMRSYFFSRMMPFMVDPYAVRQRLGEYSNRVSEEQLYYESWKASVRCNRETMRFCPPTLWGGPTSQQVISWNMPRTYATDMFTEVESAINILKKLYGRMILEVDRKQQGLDFSSEVDATLIKNLGLVIQSMRKEWDMYYQEISVKKAHMASVQKSASFPFEVVGAQDISIFGGRRPRSRFRHDYPENRLPLI